MEQKLREEAQQIFNTTEVPFQFTEEQINTYTTVGGTPFLDGDYTVFGEVVEGFNVIDSIAKAKTDLANRPLKNIPMKVKVIK